MCSGTRRAEAVDQSALDSLAGCNVLPGVPLPPERAAEVNSVGRAAPSNRLRRRLRLEPRRPPLQQRPQLLSPELQPHVERPEQPVERAGLVEAHLVDQLLEHHGIVGEEVDAPLPVVEADGTGDDLGHPAGVAPADEAVVLHHPLPLRERGVIPVLFLAPFLVHGIEADVAPGRYVGPEPAFHGLARLNQIGLHLLFSTPGCWGAMPFSSRER